MKLSVIIVSYNTKSLLEKCLESIRASTLDKKAYEVIVIDNGSTDGSAKLAMIKNKQNLGYAVANNQGIKIARGEYILLLNSDTEVKPTALEALVNFMDFHSQAGIASAQLLNPDGSIQPSGGYLPRLSNITLWMFFIDGYHIQNPAYYQKTRQVGWVQGAALIMRKSVGLLDENIFMYGEDVELCLRAKKAGWQVWTVATAQVIHHAFQSSGGVSSNALLGEYQGLLYLFKKHKPFWEIPLLKLLLKTGALLRMLLFGTILRDREKYAVYQKAFKFAR